MISFLITFYSNYSLYKIHNKHHKLIKNIDFQFIRPVLIDYEGSRKSEWLTSMCHEMIYWASQRASLSISFTSLIAITCRNSKDFPLSVGQLHYYIQNGPNSYIYYTGPKSVLSIGHLSSSLYRSYNKLFHHRLLLPPEYLSVLLGVWLLSLYFLIYSFSRRYFCFALFSLSQNFLTFCNSRNAIVRIDSCEVTLSGNTLIW